MYSYKRKISLIRNRSVILSHCRPSPNLSVILSPILYLIFRRPYEFILYVKGQSIQGLIFLLYCRSDLPGSN